MYKTLITYDGTHYFGWQKTRSGPSIQEELEKALYQITGETTLPEAASRTDRGVHAHGQVVQFQLKKEWAPHTLQMALNARLPKDIRVLGVERKEFHPTLDAVSKEYHYRICNQMTQDPTLRLYSWHIPYSLNQSRIEVGIQEVLGTHDFTAFANEVESNPICTLESIAFDGSLFRLRGNRFLYKMVRNLVGTLLYIGAGKLASIGPILASKDRKKAGVSAPAHGLYLHQVFYP